MVALPPALAALVVPLAVDPFSVMPAMDADRVALERIATRLLEKTGLPAVEARARLAELLAAGGVFPEPEDPASVRAWLAEEPPTGAH